MPSSRLRVPSIRGARRLGLVLGSALVLAAAGSTLAAGILGTRGSVDPSTLVTYGGVIRYPAVGPWRYVAGDGAHVVAGFEGISCSSTTGNLTLTYRRVASIASAWVTDDETQATRGIMAGPSVGLDHLVIKFSRMTANGPVRVRCADPILRGDTANFWVGLVAVPVASPPLG